MENSIIASIRSLIENVDRDRNIEINEALDRLQSELAALIKNKDDGFDFESAFCDIFDNCRKALQVETRPNMSLLDYFSTGGYISKTIKSDVLLKELSKRDPVFKKLSKLQPITDASAIDEFNRLLEKILRSFIKKNFTQFIEGDPNQKRSSEIESGVYLVDGEVELIIRSSDKTQKATFPDFILKLTRKSIQIYFHHPIEDVWKIYDGTIYFNGLAQEITDSFNQLVSRACKVKKSFNFTEELEEIKQRCFEIANHRDKLKSIIVDQLGRIIYTSNNVVLADSNKIEFVSFYFYAKNIKTEINISFVSGDIPKQDVRVTHFIDSLKVGRSMLSVEVTSIPTAEQHQIVEVARSTTAAFLNLINSREVEW